MSLQRPSPARQTGCVALAAAWGRLARLIAIAPVAALALLGGCSKGESDLQLFREVTDISSLGAYAGMTHGAAWGDFDGDGLPDLYVSNHLNPAQLFRNLGGGRFENVTGAVFAANDLGGDKHGAAWADFDNDGRRDLVQLTGAHSGVGAEGKRLFHNIGIRLLDVAEPMGVANPYGRTRMPLWLDLDGDGKLDLLQGAEARFDDKTPPFVFLQSVSGFKPADESLKLASRSAPFCVLTNLTGDDRPNLVCRLMGQEGALQVFDAAKLPAKPLELLPQTAFEDIAAADFDNDGRIDLFMARKNAPGAVAFGRPSAQQLVASVSIDSANVGQPMGFNFRAKGGLKIQLDAAFPRGALTPDRVFLGGGSTHPAGLSFDVSPEIGTLVPPVPGTQTAVHIGFTAPDRWEVRISASREALTTGKAKYQDVQTRVTATGAVTEVEPVGETRAEEAPARLFMNRGNGKLVEESEKRGVNQRLVAGVNVVAGDFNNDMHMDLFVLASGDIGRQENLLLLNDGTGHFKVVKAAGGASGGSLGGVGDSVTTADVDGDGFPDLLIATGGSMGRSLGLPSDAGGYRLFRNIGNGNHWIMLDLEGTRSNRDGIGAMVRVTAGGVTQTRMQDGGQHHRGQNHSRLHFGLAKQKQVDKISVHWPSGTVQELSGVKADQVLRIKEPAANP